jgi:predicted nucleotidyltransferase
MNNRFGITEKSYNYIVSYLKTKPQIEAVILFGSRAKGNYKRGSDIDLAIKGKESSPELAIDIESFINEEIPVPYTVDVVDYNSLKKKELKEHIDRVGVLFYQN